MTGDVDDRVAAERTLKGTKRELVVKQLLAAHHAVFANGLERDGRNQRVGDDAVELVGDGFESVKPLGSPRNTHAESVPPVLARDRQDKRIAACERQNN